MSILSHVAIGIIYIYIMPRVKTWDNLQCSVVTAASSATGLSQQWPQAHDVCGQTIETRAFQEYRTNEN
jgi:hypothetical protein